MLDTSFFSLLMYTYLALVIAKSILCYMNIPIVVASLDRHYGKHTVFRTIGCLLIIPITILFYLPVSLREEGLRFFLVYSRFTAVRDAHKGHAPRSDE